MTTDVNGLMKMAVIPIADDGTYDPNAMQRLAVIPVGTDGRVLETADQVSLEAQGLIAETMPRQLATEITAMLTQQVYYTLIPLRAGQVVTNLSVAINAAGSSNSFTKFGLYNSSLALVASSADDADHLETTGIRTLAMTSAYTVPATGGYYAAVLCLSASMPTIFRGGLSVAANAVGSGLRPFAHQTTQNDLPATAVFGSAGGGTLAIWMGAS